MAAPESNYSDEHSAAATTITFDRPIPLLRGPVRAGPPEEPSSGPYVLAFRDSKTWANAYGACESKIIEQCDAGARIGCAVSASEKCKPPWWRALIGPKVPDLKRRAQCEEREMEGCLAAARGRCAAVAKEKCLKPFREARIAKARGVNGNGVSAKEAEKLIGLIGLGKLGFWGLRNWGLGSTNCEASELLGCDCEVDRVLGGGNVALKV